MTRNRKGRRWGARIVAFALMLTMTAWLLPADWQEASAATDTYGLSDPTTDSDGTVTWDCVYFGNYPQSSDGNGGFKTEKIKWRVLSVDGNDAFLLADQNLDCQPYNTSFTDVTWETCTLRSWLNGYGSNENAYGTDYSSDNFIDAAFSSSERGAITTTTVENEDNPYYGTEGGDDTQDKVYLLSIGEALDTGYGFSSDRTECDEARRTKNTDYAEDQGAWTSTSTDYDGNGWWWLRSLGGVSHCAARVYYGGDLNCYGNGVYDNLSAVRPALHLNLGSDVWSDAGTVSSDGTETTTTQIPGTINNYYGVAPSQNTPADDVQDAAKDFIKAMNNYLAELKKATETDMRSIQKNSKTPAQLLREADEASDEKIITMQLTTPDDAMDSVYETLAQYLDLYVETGKDLGKIDLSGSTIEVSADIVKKIRNNLDTLTFKSKIGNYTVTINVTQFLWIYSGSVTAVDGSGEKYTGVIVSKPKDTAKAMNEYIDTMSDWVKDALYESLKSIFSELSEITGVADYTKSEIAQLLKDKVNSLQAKGYGNLLTYWQEMRDGYDLCETIVTAKDTSSLTDALKNAKSLYKKIEKLDYSDEAVSNNTVKAAMEKVVNAQDKLGRSLYAYIYGSENEEESLWDKITGTFKRIFIQCPVDFAVYNGAGKKLGSVNGSEVTCASDIAIEVDGDSKKVAIPSGIDASIEFKGTGTGALTYVMEQVVNDKTTGRSIYYNVPLTKGCTYVSEVPSEILTKDNGTALKGSDKSYDVSEYVAVDDKNANVTITCNTDEGGVVLGAGKYAKADPVVLTAYPKNSSYKFEGWYVDDVLVELASIYRFAAASDTTVEARFEKIKEKDPDYTVVMSDGYEETTDVHVYKAENGKNDIVISMAGREGTTSLQATVKKYKANGSVANESTVKTEYDNSYRFTISAMSLTGYPKVKIYDSGQNLICTISKNSSTNQKSTAIKASNITKTYGSKPFKLGASTNSGGKLSYKSSNTKVATISQKGIVTIKGTGRTTVTISAAATKQYKAAKKNITLTVKPKKMAAPKLKSGKPKTLVVRWKRAAKVTGYQVVVAKDKKFKKGKKKAIVKKRKTTKKTFKNLKHKKVYYVKVRAYKKANGKRLYGSYSKVKKCKIK